MLVTLGNRGNISWRRGKYAKIYGDRLNLVDDDPRVKPLLNKLFNHYVPTQMKAPLPGALKKTVLRARASYIAIEAAFKVATMQRLVLDPNPTMRTVLGYGDNF